MDTYEEVVNKYCSILDKNKPVIIVVGMERTGKSTLINLLYGSEFTLGKTQIAQTDCIEVKKGSKIIANINNNDICYELDGISLYSTKDSEYNYCEIRLNEFITIKDKISLLFLYLEKFKICSIIMTIDSESIEKPIYSYMYNVIRNLNQVLECDKIIDNFIILKMTYYAHNDKDTILKLIQNYLHFEYEENKIILWEYNNTNSDPIKKKIEKLISVHKNNPLFANNIIKIDRDILIDYLNKLYPCLLLNKK